MATEADGRGLRRRRKTPPGGASDADGGDPRRPDGPSEDPGDIGQLIGELDEPAPAEPTRRAGPTSEAPVLTDDQIAAARAEQRRTRRPLSTVLVDLGFVTEDEVPSALARMRGMEVVDLHDYPVDASASSVVPETMARGHGAVAIGWEDGTLVVAIADPLNVLLADDLKMVTQRNVKLVVAKRADIDELISRQRKLDSDILEEAEDDDDETAAPDAVVDEAPTVRVVNQFIADAVHKRASDIHIEPEEKDLRVRFRIDGVLHDVVRVPKAHQSSIIARIKVMADANIAERRLPQDGRVSLSVEGRPVDLRIATLPSVWGEDVIIRILDRSSSVLSLEDLGYSPHARERYADAISRSHGLILVTGPTGSGKSTTLYASLRRVNDPTKKIITVEDPVEYRLPGLRQVQARTEIGLTFARALRSILRADPDVLMIGEIRDPETATIAIQAAMTGHLVLATLHTNDAPSAPTRLLDMGVPPFLVASALTCVMSQRLARKLCTNCAEPYEPEPGGTLDSVWGGAVPKQLVRPVGCRTCAETGYRSRIAIAEVMPATEGIGRLVAERRSTHEIAAVATEEGMVPLLADGLQKVREGITTVDEVLRVVG